MKTIPLPLATLLQDTNKLWRRLPGNWGKTISIKDKCFQKIWKKLKFYQKISKIRIASFWKQFHWKNNHAAIFYQTME